MPGRRLYVVVSGPPASGKSTLAPALAERLGLPLLAKDRIKDELMAVLPVPDVAASRELGRAAIAVLLAVASDAPHGAVLDANFRRSAVADALASLPGHVVEVFCRCPRDEAERRYAARAGTRHPGHFDGARSPDELWDDEASEPLAAGWPVHVVDTTRPVQLGQLVDAIRTAAG